MKKLQNEEILHQKQEELNLEQLNYLLKKCEDKLENEKKENNHKEEEMLNFEKNEKVFLIQNENHKTEIDKKRNSVKYNKLLEEKNKELFEITNKILEYNENIDLEKRIIKQ